MDKGKERVQQHTSPQLAYDETGRHHHAECHVGLQRARNHVLEWRLSNVHRPDQATRQPLRCRRPLWHHCRRRRALGSGVVNVDGQYDATAAWSIRNSELHISPSGLYFIHVFNLTKSLSRTRLSCDCVLPLLPRHARRLTHQSTWHGWAELAGAE